MVGRNPNNSAFFLSFGSGKEKLLQLVNLGSEIVQFFQQAQVVKVHVLIGHVEHHVFFDFATKFGKVIDYIAENWVFVNV